MLNLPMARHSITPVLQTSNEAGRAARHRTRAEPHREASQGLSTLLAGVRAGGPPLVSAPRRPTACCRLSRKPTTCSVRPRDGRRSRALRPALTITMWLPVRRAIRQPKVSSARTTSSGRSNGSGGIRPPARVALFSIVRGMPPSARTWRQARIASSMLARASSFDAPWLTQPGIAGHSAIQTPSSSRSSVALDLSVAGSAGPSGPVRSIARRPRTGPRGSDRGPPTPTPS